MSDAAERARAQWADPVQRQRLVDGLRRVKRQRPASPPPKPKPVRHVAPEVLDPILLDDDGMEPADPEVAALITSPLPDNDTPEAQLLLVCITVDPTLRRTLILMRDYVRDYGADMMAFGHLAYLADGLVGMDPELGDPATVTARLAVLIGAAVLEAPAHTLDLVQPEARA